MPGYRVETSRKSAINAKSNVHASAYARGKRKHINKSAVTRVKQTHAINVGPNVKKHGVQVHMKRKTQPQTSEK